MITAFIVALMSMIPQGSRQRAVVTVSVVDTFGFVLGENVTGEFTLTNRENAKAVFKSRRPMFQDVPFGEYDLQMSPDICPGSA
jgi:hypothetical protein